MAGVKKELMDILVCPLCKGKLELNVEEEQSGSIFKGSLYCPKEKLTYPIDNGIPNLLPPGT